MRVWITGIGLVTSLGVGASSTFAKLLAGERGLRNIDLFDTTGQRATLGAQVDGIEVPEGPGWSRASAFAKVAAAQALAQAGIDPRHSRVGLVVGGTTAGMFENEVTVAAMVSGKMPLGPDPGLRSHPLSSTTDVLDASIGPFVRTRSVASACSSGATALVLAMAWLREEERFDAVVAGGTDALCRLTLSGFNALAAIDPEPCRPFDRSRRGLNLGEGAGFLVLERAQSARRRGRAPIAELAGGALAAEAHHITNPESEGTTPARVMREAIERAGITPAELDYVNAHGTATPLNDAMEAKALASVLGAETSRIFVSSSKAQIGHTLAAAGAIEAAISALAIAERALPPTAGLGDVDPACSDLRHLREAARPERVRAVLSSSFGFGGMDAALVLTTPELGSEREVSRGSVFVSASAALTPRGLVDAASLMSGEASAGAIPDLATGALDQAKARRFDRSARLCATAAEAVLRGSGVDRARCGVVFGSAFSAVDESAAFVQRIFEKGPRMVSPAEFPNLVPSSPVGHASIYQALRGPALATADLRVSGESAVQTAIELMEAGQADAFVAGAIGVRSRLIDQAFHPLFDHHASDAPRTECCAAVLLVTTPAATRPLARIVASWTVRDGEPLALPPPESASLVVSAVSSRDVAGVLAPTSWRGVTVRTTELGAGSNEAAGAAAIGAAARLIDAGEASHVLVLGLRIGWRVALLLARAR